MDTKDLEAFNAVYKYRSLSNAAKSLYISPQGLSKTIKKLERELNTALFTRKPTGMEPTAAGDRLYTRSHDIIRLLSSISSDFLTLPNDYIVPCTSYSVRFISPDIFAYMHSLFPDIQLNLIEKPDYLIDEMLFNGKAEIAIMQAPVNSARYSYMPLMKFSICVIANEDNPLSQQVTLSLKDLCGQSILYVGGDIFSPLQQRAASFREAGLHLIEVLDNDFCWMSASDNTHIAITPVLIEYRERFPNVKCIPLINEDEDLCTWELGIVHKCKNRLSSYAQVFINYVEKNLHLLNNPIGQ